MKLLLLTLLLASCTKNKAQPATNLWPALEAKAVLYIQEQNKLLDSDGWILADECDALLHSSLASLGGAVIYADILKARALDGRWYRRPSKDCLEKGESKSSISRDQILGLLLAMLQAKDVDGVNELIEYAKKQNFIIGEHDGSVDGLNRVIVSPSIYRLMGQVKDALEGKANLVETTRDSDVDFTDHLAGLAILLRGEIFGEISDYDLFNIRSYSNRDPNNALYWAIRGRYDPDIAGDYSRVVHILSNEQWFPKERLPTSADRSAEYLWMHGENPGDWNPDEEGRQHYGHDFTLAVWVMIHD